MQIIYYFVAYVLARYALNREIQNCDNYYLVPLEFEIRFLSCATVSNEIVFDRFLSIVELQRDR